ncbi:hypothetical protein L6452_20767 [Arctium lappa]|uniref:Uncharacterized protein n=1 Tax=Arctium lappa TaxID=4217 RepID=A0ACB9BCU2_ARCLA|nr:hypothetical protein L6452_20767 [Arctium lappa]
MCNGRNRGGDVVGGEGESSGGRGGGRCLEFPHEQQHAGENEKKNDEVVHRTVEKSDEELDRRVAQTSVRRTHRPPWLFIDTPTIRRPSNRSDFSVNDKGILVWVYHLLLLPLSVKR